MTKYSRRDHLESFIFGDPLSRRRRTIEYLVIFGADSNCRDASGLFNAALFGTAGSIRSWALFVLL